MSWDHVRRWLGLGGQPKEQPLRAEAPPENKEDPHRAEINRLVAEFLAEGHQPVIALANLRSGEIGYHGINTTGGFALTGNGWVHNEFSFCAFALNTDGVWSYVGFYGVRDHHYVDKVKIWEGTPNYWLEIDEREFRHYTDTGTASPQHALEAARVALVAWRRSREV